MDPPDEGDNTRGKWRIEHGRLITTWRFSDESSDSAAVEEIIELTEKIFKSRIISQEGPGKPEAELHPEAKPMGAFSIGGVLDKSEAGEPVARSF